ncbi:hypothetical protein ACUOFC_19560, partial [Escherichia sp. TWPC-MK]
LRTGWTAFDEEKTELINQTVTCHIDRFFHHYKLLCDNPCKIRSI